MSIFDELDLEREMRREFYSDYYAELRKAQSKIKKEKTSTNNDIEEDKPF